MFFLGFPNLYLKVSDTLLSFSSSGAYSPWHGHPIITPASIKDSYHDVVEKCHARFLYCQVFLS